jgi:hypothetical protein
VGSAVAVRKPKSCFSLSERRTEKHVEGVEVVSGLILKLRITWVFFFGYLLVNYLYLQLPRNLILNYGIVFLTSPFNVLETLSPVYNSVAQGLQENFEILVAVILIAEVFSRYSMVRLKPYLTIDWAFALGIAASYVTSALWWWHTGVPGSGTSIVAFSILLFLASAASLDVKRRMKDARTKAELKRDYIWIAALVTSFGFLPTYVVGNPHYQLHIVGALVFGSMVGLLAETRSARQARQGSESSSNESFRVSSR